MRTEANVPSYTGYNARTHALSTAHTDPANETADRHERQHARSPPFGHNKEFDADAGHDAERHPHEKARRDEKPLEAFDRRHRLLFGGVEGEDGRAEDAENAAYPALGIRRGIG